MSTNRRAEACPAKLTVHNTEHHWEPWVVVQLFAEVDSSPGNKFVITDVYWLKSSWRNYGRRNEMPSDEGDSSAYGGGCLLESRLVAESVEPAHTPPELSRVQPHGPGVQ